ncbi:hypothetical protein HYV69_03465 [Candidatus Uhrbacteria bacterium]|nr:hypothetical protein [Candidatus Uhrbacteria bacterium]
MSKKYGLIILSLVFLVGIVFVLNSTALLSEESKEKDTGEQRMTKEDIHIPLPSEVRGLYWTASTAGSERADELLSYMKERGLNTVVIDLKMDDGKIAFIPKSETLKIYQQTEPAITDFDGLLVKLFDNGIYRIARIAVMRDRKFGETHPEFAMKQSNGDFWTDKIGSIWVDPAAPEVAHYAIELAREAYARGFDEVQFDYVRFASDGTTNSIVYPVYDYKKSKVEIIRSFFKTIGEAMREEKIPVSFDVFGMTFWSFDDFNIGQRLIDVLPYADFVSPMVYPSHYVDGFEGFANPAEFPYEIVKRSLDEGTRLTHGFYSDSDSKLRSHWRPWLQDFDIGAVYTADMVEAQIKAARDAGASGWILWNARNVYEPAEY